MERRAFFHNAWNYFYNAQKWNFPKFTSETMLCTRWKTDQLI